MTNGRCVLSRECRTCVVMEFDLEAEKQEILRRYRGLLRAAKNSKKRSERKAIRKAFDVALAGLPLAAAARCAALACVVAAGLMGALAEERCNGEGGLVNLPKVGPPTFSACDGWMTTRCGAAAGSLASSDGHNSEQPASRKPHAKGKTNLYIFLIFRRHPANPLLYMPSILL